MNKQFKYWEFQEPIKDKPLVKQRVVVAALVSIAVVLFVGSIVWKICERMMDKTRVYNMDCMEGMKEFPDKYFDLAIVDPPYGIGVSSTIHHQPATVNKITNYPAKKWDNSIPEKEYFYELFRVSSHTMIWGGNYFSNFLPSSKDWVIWDKEQPEDMHFSQAELCWNNVGAGVRIFRRSIAKDQNRVSNGAPSARGYVRIHPTQKPVQLYKWLLKNYAKEGDKILDTHLGSQSSRIAAFDMGFDFTGYELDKDYFEAGNKRFNQHKAQLKLFV